MRRCIEYKSRLSFRPRMFTVRLDNLLDVVNINYCAHILRFVAVLNVLYNHLHCPHNHCVSLFLLRSNVSNVYLQLKEFVRSYVTLLPSLHFSLHIATILGKAQAVYFTDVSLLFATRIINSWNTLTSNINFSSLPPSGEL